MVHPPGSSSPDAPGYGSRRVAADILDGVLRRGRPLDEQLESGHASQALKDLSERDRALTRRIVATTLRRLGTLRRLIGDLLDHGLPPNAPLIESALLTGAAQLLFLDIPHHAAVDLSVRLVRADRRSARYAGLVNAVLRRVARAGTETIAALEPLCLDTPEWMLARWQAVYGAETARAIAHANGQEPALDLTVKADPERWATQLGGRVLPTGSVRLLAHGPIATLPGYSDGNWWVQDAAAAVPTRLFGELRGRSVVDICAAPGGKTAQLALSGATVTAVDRSEARMARLRENLQRLGLQARTIVAPAETLEIDEFDAVLVDAPCTSTGTIRRHPDIPWRRAPVDIGTLAQLQTRLLNRAVALSKPGGTIVFCTCSLEPEEGENIISGLLEQDHRVRRTPIAAEEFPAFEGFVTPTGDVRTLPCHWPDSDARMSGLDGFFAARLERL